MSFKLTFTLYDCDVIVINQVLLVLRDRQSKSCAYSRQTSVTTI